MPIPSFESFDALNADLEQHCLRRFEDRLRGHNETIGERLERDLEKLLTSAGRTVRRQRQARDEGQFSVPGQIPDQ